MDKRPTPNLSPARMVMAIAISVAAVEMLIMAVLHFIPVSPGLKIVMDSLFLILILSPVIYFFVFRPVASLTVELRESEEELRSERNRVKKYLDIAGSMIVVLDRNARVTLINRKGSEILGYPESAIIGKDWTENFIPQRMRGEVRKTFEAVLRGEPAAERFENPVLTGTGEEKVILFNNTVLTEDGNVVGTLSSGLDISERKIVEEELRESEARYRLIHNTVFDAILIVNRYDIILDCNPSAEKIFGYTRDELLSMDLKKLMPEKYRGRHYEGIQRFITTGQSRIIGRIFETEAVRKNGEVFPIELVITTLNLGGEITFNGMIRDITERKEAEKEKERIQMRLNQSQKMEAIGRFAGGIAHDFNNILTAVRGNAELALEDIDKTSPVYARLDGIIMSVLLASKLTKQLLLFSRGQPFETAPVNINKTVENLLMMISRLIGEGITVTADLAPDIWTIEADAGNIEQVIMNLSINAKDAMPQGGTLTIKTENVVITEEQAKRIPEARQGRAVCITVGDTGMGMKKEVLQHIFEPFFTTKAVGKGTGFGLTVVYGIVKQHGGWIRVKSRPAEGTAFHVFLPVEKGRPARKEHGHMPVITPGGERILLVEEDSMVRSFASDTLRKHGYKVFDANSAARAREVFERERGAFDLLFTGLLLPDGTGLDLAGELLSKGKGVSVLVTGTLLAIKDRPDVREKGYKYLQKPYSLQALLRAVATSMQKQA